MDLLDKLRAVEKRQARFADGSAMPGLTVVDGVLGPCEVVVRGRPTLMFGSNNYLGLTLHPEVIDARAAPWSSTAPAPPARGRPTGRWRCTRSSSATSPTGSGSVTPSSSAPATRPICR